MILVYLMIAAAVGVWTVPLLRRCAPVTWLAGVVVVGVVFGPLYQSFDTPGLSLSLDRLLLLLVAGLLLLEFRGGRLNAFRLQRHDVVLLFLTGWLGLRTIGVTAPVEESPPLSRWLTFFAMPVFLYMLTRWTRISRNTLETVVSVLLGLGAYLSITALLEVTGRHGFVFPQYIVDPDQWEFLGRARGPLMNPTANGVFLVTTLAIASSRWLHAARWGKVGYGFVLMLILAGVGATLTRSVWMSALILAALISMAYLPRWSRVLALSTSVLLVGLIVIGGTESLLSIKRDKELSASAAAKSVELRPLLLIVAWEMFRDAPILGHGYGGYFHAAVPYHQIRTYEMPLETVRPYMQHNVISSLAVDAGLIAAVLMIVWLLTVGVLGWRLMADRSRLPCVRCLGTMMLGCVVGYVINGMFHDVSVMPMTNTLLFFGGALVTNVAVVGFAAEPQRTAAPFSHPARFPIDVTARSVSAHALTRAD